jgi:transcriptional regulator with XRE-family HTH domain
MPPLVLPALLRHLRTQAGLSQAGLAERLREITGTYSVTRHDISRYERGRRKPQAWLPALAVALGVDLAVLEAVAAPASLTLADPARHLAALTERRYIDTGLASDLAELLAASRRLEDQIGSGVLIRTVTGQAALAGHLASESRGLSRSAMVRVAAGWEQFTGWLHASTGDHPNAITHYRAALELAEETADHDMVSTALSMRGHVAWMAGKTAAMLSLSQAAQRDAQRLSPTVLALSVQQEARAHAIEGDYYQMEAGLDHAAALIARASSHPDTQYFYSPAYLEMQRGMAYRLAADGAAQREEAVAPGLYQMAINSLQGGMREFDPHTMASEWATWYVAELARAHTGTGSPTPAAVHALHALNVARAASGARLEQAVKDIHRDLTARWPGEDEVVRLGEQLAST